MFDGSDIATMSVAPARFTGSTMCLRATSLGTSFSTSASTSKSFRLIDGRLYCRARNVVRSLSWTKPSWVSAWPSRLPDRLASSWAFWSCWREINFSRTRSSPNRDMSLDPRPVIGQHEGPLQNNGKIMHLSKRDPAHVGAVRQTSDFAHAGANLFGLSSVSVGRAYENLPAWPPGAKFSHVDGERDNERERGKRGFEDSPGAA